MCLWELDKYKQKNWGYIDKMVGRASSKVSDQTEPKTCFSAVYSTMSFNVTVLNLYLNHAVELTMHLNLFAGRLNNDKHFV